MAVVIHAYSSQRGVGFHYKPQGSTFPAAQGHMPLEIAVGP